MNLPNPSYSVKSDHETAFRTNPRYCLSKKVASSTVLQTPVSVIEVDPHVPKAVLKWRTPTMFSALSPHVTASNTAPHP